MPAVPAEPTAAANAPPSSGKAPARAAAVSPDQPAVIITGIVGRLGRRLARRLHREHRVIGIDRRPFDGRPKDIEHHQVDLRSKKARDVFRAGGVKALVHLGVSGVRHRKARRASPRVAVSTPATAMIKYCRSLPRDTELEVRLVDISATGCAFVTQKELATGDLVRVRAILTSRAIDLEARVVRIDPAPYQRYRAGCEITEISDLSRKTISALAAQSAESGSEDQRNPEEAAARAESRAATTALSARLGSAVIDDE